MAIRGSVTRSRVKWYWVLTLLTLVSMVTLLFGRVFPALERQRMEAAGDDAAALPPPPVTSGPASTTEDKIDIVQRDPALQVVILLDQSGSMKTTDPKHLRIEGVRYLLANLSWKSAEDNPNLATVIEFGSHPAPPIPSSPATLAGGAVPAAFKGLAARDLQDTAVAEALGSAANVFASSPESDRKRRIILFTDGTPDDSRKLSQAAYFSEIAKIHQERLKPAGVELFVVGLDATGQAFTPSQAEWVRVAGKDRVSILREAGELKQHFNRVVRSMLNLPKGEPVVLSTSRPESEQEVGPNLARLEFHFFPSQPDWEVEVVRPDGKVAKKASGRSGGYSIVSLKAPPAGTWKLRYARGSSPVEVYRDDAPMRLGLVHPLASGFPQGKPMRLVLSLAQSSGSRITPDPANPLAVTALVASPGGEQTQVTFSGPDSLGLFTADKTAPTSTAGRYQVGVRVQWGTRWYHTQDYEVNVVSRPYLQIDEPSAAHPADTAPQCPVRCRLFREGHPVAIASQVQDNPDRLVLVQLKAGPGKVDSKALYVPQARNSEDGFAASLPVDVSQAGRYLLAFRMRPLLKGATQRLPEEIETVAFQSMPSDEKRQQAEEKRRLAAAAKKRAVTTWSVGSVVGFLVLNALLFFACLRLWPTVRGEMLQGTLRVGSKTYPLRGGLHEVTIGGASAWVTADGKDGARTVVALVFRRWVGVFWPTVETIRKSDPEVNLRGTKIKLS